VFLLGVMGTGPCSFVLWKWRHGRD